jgi:hypothetical protein
LDDHICAFGGEEKKGILCSFEKYGMDSLNGNVLSLGCFSQYIKVHINMLEKMTVWSKTIHIVDNKEFIFPVVLIIRPWDPGIITATTWGQVVFRGSGNVMTQMETKRSPKAIKPSHQVISQLRPKHPLHRARSATQEGRQQIIKKKRKQRERKSTFFLLRPCSFVSDWWVGTIPNRIASLIYINFD